MRSIFAVHTLLLASIVGFGQAVEAQQNLMVTYACADYPRSIESLKHGLAMTSPEPSTLDNLREHQEYVYEYSGIGPNMRIVLADIQELAPSVQRHLGVCCKSTRG